MIVGFALSLAITAALAASLKGQARPVTPDRPLFREITFAPFDPIRLGEPIAKNSPAGQPLGTDRIVLIQGFGGTDSIIVQFNKANRVIALDFVYPTQKDYSVAIAGYITSLGRTFQRTVTDSANGRLERTVWEDQRTRFEVARFSRSSKAVRFVSRISDRRGSHP